MKNYLKPTIKVHPVTYQTMLCASKVSVSNDNEYQVKKEQLAAIEARIHELEEIQTKNLPEKIDPKDKWTIYGVNLLESPSDKWVFKGAETTPSGGKLEVFEYRIPLYDPNNNAFPFKKVKANVIDDDATNFCFEEIPFNEDIALDIVFAYVRNFLKNGEYTHEQCRIDYHDQVAQHHNSFDIINPDSQDRLFFSTDDENMHATIMTGRVYENKPKVAEDFVPDMYMVFKKGLETLSMCITLCQISGEIAGTRELLQECNQLVIVPIKRDELPAKDRAASTILSKNTPLKIASNEVGYLLTTEEEGIRVGYVPSNLSLGMDPMVKNNFIESIKIFDIEDGCPRVIITFAMNE